MLFSNILIDNKIFNISKISDEKFSIDQFVLSHVEKNGASRHIWGMSRYHYQNPKVLFEGKRVDVLSVEAEHPKGGVIRREVVDHPGAVVILPLLDSATVILIQNERYVVQKTLWELPAGTLEGSEDPFLCAARELEEETGYRAKKISHLCDFYSTPGFCNEKLFAYVAENLTFSGQNLDETEKITAQAVSFAEVLKMIEEGIICDAKTICTLLYFHTLK